MKEKGDTGPSALSLPSSHNLAQCQAARQLLGTVTVNMKELQICVIKGLTGETQQGEAKAESESSTAADSSTLKVFPDAAFRSLDRPISYHY